MFCIITLAAVLTHNPSFQCWEKVCKGDQKKGEEAISTKMACDMQSQSFSYFESHLMLEFMKMYLIYKVESNAGSFNKNGSIETALEKIDTLITTAVQSSIID